MLLCSQAVGDRDRRVLDVAEVLALGVQVAGQGDLEGEEMAESGEGREAAVAVGGFSADLGIGGGVDGEADLAGEAEHIWDDSELSALSYQPEMIAWLTADS